ncbi:uncharacterized protein LOC136027985 isoform X2 [Artemia franciscana]|nr:hypothetical protein QYM36_014308 [Artemia franciscana]
MSSSDPPPVSAVGSPPRLSATVQLTPLVTSSDTIEEANVDDKSEDKIEESDNIGESVNDKVEESNEKGNIEGEKELNKKGSGNILMDVDESSSMSPARLQINLDEDHQSADSSEKPDQSEPSSCEMGPILEPEVVLAEKINGNTVEPDSKEDEIEVLQEKPAEPGRVKVKRDLMYTEEEIQQNQNETLLDLGESPLHKKPKLGNESLAAILSRPLINSDKPCDIQHPSLVTANDMIVKLQKDIKTLHYMAKQKEKEWNYILRLKKMKEEMEMKLRRQKEILHFTLQGVEPDLANISMPPMNEAFVRNHADQTLRHMNGIIPQSGGQMQLPGIGNLPSVSPPTISPMNTPLKVENYRRDMPLLSQQMIQPPSIPVQNKPPPQYKPQPMVQIPASAALGLASRSNSQSPGPVPPTPPNPNSTNSAITALLNSRLQKQRPILPKPQEIQNMGNAQWMDEMTDPRNRVGPTVNVQRIIDDYRAKHPEDTSNRSNRRGGPPNGKFVPPSFPMHQSGINMNKKLQNPTATSGGNFEIGGVTVNQGGEKVSLESFLQQRIKESPSGVNFKDLLLQFAKLSQTAQQNQSQNENIDLSKVAAALSNSDITLQPILPGTKNQSQQKKPSPTSTPPAEATSSSILHGALSGTIARGEISVKPANSNYTPTLASLLTSSTDSEQPEVLTLSNLLNTSKGQVTITKPKEVTSEARCLPSMLVVDDSRVTVSPSSSSTAAGPSTSNGSNSKKDDQEVPKCQGCSSKPAQFVCAGCGSQWYCSRECQVDAWEDHSDNCVG